jgi:hypothetical protein
MVANMTQYCWSAIKFTVCCFLYGTHVRTRVQYTRCFRRRPTVHARQHDCARRLASRYEGRIQILGRRYGSCSWLDARQAWPWQKPEDCGVGEGYRGDEELSAVVFQLRWADVHGWYDYVGSTLMTLMWDGLVASWLYDYLWVGRFGCKYGHMVA